MKFSTLEQAVAYLNKFQFHGFRLGLERISAVLKKLGNPHQFYESIHVAGTNGKGSVCAATTSILKESGLKVGLYTSPHLLNLNERFQVNLKEISDDELKELIKEIALLVESGFELSYFEFTTAMAFLYFKEIGVDVAVIETGLGGRLDATNILLPKVCAITNIALEHMTYLGDTIEKIAYEKAGIIKEKSKVITGSLKKAEREVIEKVAQKKKADVIRFGKDFLVKNFSSITQSFDYFYGDFYLKDISFGLFGRHQIENAAIATSICIELKKLGFDIQDKAIRKGLKSTSWPGRSEILKGPFYVFLEGAHNEAGLKVLLEQIEFLQHTLKIKKKSLLWACSNEGNDKNPLSMLRTIANIFDKVVITEPKGPRRPVFIEEWTKMNIDFPVKFQKNLYNAIDELKENCSSEKDLLVVAGSLYLVGPARKYFLDLGWKNNLS